MPSILTQTEKFEALRKQAEALLAHRRPDPEEPPPEMLELIHELRVHQAELEIQNEDLKRAQQELSTLHAEFEDLYEFAPVGYVTLNPKGTITRANLTAVRLLGLERQLLVRTPLSRFFAAGQAEQLRAALRYVGQTDKRQDIDLPLDRQETPRPWIRVQLEADREPDQSVLQWRVVLSDITERHHAQEELAQAHQALSQEALRREGLEEQRLELEDQVRHAQRLESVGRLAGGVAHDFNNMLTVILSTVELILPDLSEQDPLYGDLQQIQNAGKRAGRLTGQLLAFSRKQLLQTQVINLAPLVVNLDSMLHRILGEDIVLRIDPDHASWNVKADPGQLEQVLINLAINSCDAMPSGGQLTIKTANVPGNESAVHRTEGAAPPADFVMLSITDSGHGMSAEVAENAFDPFYTTKEAAQGTGLGLSTVHGIIKQHGGDIRVHSTEGTGTTFELLLPRATDLTATRVGTGPHSNDIVYPQGTETVLVAEDEPMVRKLAVHFLRKQGYQVLEASDGLAAITVSENHAGAIELLLTDIRMPRLNGPKAAEQILRARPGLRVLYMSGYADEAIGESGVLDADTWFVHKPFALDDLARSVREVLDDTD